MVWVRARLISVVGKFVVTVGIRVRLALGLQLVSSRFGIIFC